MSIWISQVTEIRDCDGELIDSDTVSYKVSFRELLDTIESLGTLYPSSWPVTELGEHDWLSSDPYTDYVTGNWEVQSLHWDRDKNPDFKLKYWDKAYKYATGGN